MIEEHLAELIALAAVGLVGLVKRDMKKQNPASVAANSLFHRLADEVNATTVAKHGMHICRVQPGGQVRSR